MMIDLPARRHARSQNAPRIPAHVSLTPFPTRTIPAAALLFSLFFSNFAFSDLQQQPAQLAGVVVARQGSKPLPGMTVKLLAAEDAVVAETVTAENGVFSFSNVPEGTFKIQVTGQGFRDYSDTVRTFSGKSQEIVISLQLRELNETVEVGDRAGETLPQTAAPLETLKPRAVDIEPVKGDNYQSLLPMVAGVVRGPDGRINVKGASAVQSGLLVSSSNATDPSTGNPGFELPADAIETVDVLANPYSAEYGRFSSGVTQIQTRKGEAKWGYLLNNFLPRYKWRGGHLMGIERYTPRISGNGPLIRDRVFVAQAFQYRMIKTPVPGQPVLQRDQRFESFDSFTRLDARLSQRNLLTVTFALFPKKQDFLNLDTFNPKEVNPNLHNRGLHAGFQETAVFDTTQTLETTVTYRRYDSDVFGQGYRPMSLYTFGNRGIYFNRQARRTMTTQWTEYYSKLAGRHLIKLGVDLVSGTFKGSGSSGTINILRADGTLNTKIEYLETSRQDFSATSLGFFAQDHWRISDRLAMEFGLRVDRDGVLAKYNLAPRGGLVVSVLPGGRGVVRGGAGLFYEQTPMNVAAFATYERQTITRIGADGITPAGPSITWQQAVQPGLDTPYSVIWNIEYDHRLSQRWTARVNYMRRYGRHEYLIDPVVSATGSTYLLDSRGRSRYRETELTVRYARRENFELSWSYVRSRSESDLNSYDLFFGNLRDPIIRPNEFSLTPIDVPNRLLFRTLVPIGWHVIFSSMTEIRNGFPYSAYDESRRYVGSRNHAGRFPTLATLDLRLTKPVKFWKYNLEVGVFAFHILNSFTPRDVQANVNASDYGTFYNTIPRNWGFSILVRK